MSSLCGSCAFNDRSFNGSGTCLMNNDNYKKIPLDGECNDYCEEEDCGLSSEELGIGQDEPGF